MPAIFVCYPCSDTASVRAFVRAVDSAVLSTLGALTSIRDNDIPKSTGLIVFASSTAFFVPLRKAAMKVCVGALLFCHVCGL